MFNIFNPYSRENSIKRKKELTAGMITDKKIDVEVGWILLKQAEKERDEMIKKAKENLDEIKAEKEKTPIDMEKIKKLVDENIDLGWTGVKMKGGKDKYERKILQADVKVASFYGEIEKAVGEREYLLLRLIAIGKLK